MQNVGFVGIGAMGFGMAKNTLDSGFEVYTYDVDEKKQAKMKEKGAKPAKSVRELGENVEIAVTMLPMSPVEPVLENVVAGEGGLISSMDTGDIIIDGGNTSPQMTKELAEKCYKKEIYFLDIPVSGGPIGAEEGKLSAMAGGCEEAFKKAKPVLESFCGRIEYFGSSGSGQAVKLVNNIIVAVNLAVLSEALVFAKKMDLDIEQVYNSISGGAAGSWVMDNYGKKIIERTDNHETPEAGKGGRDRQLSWAINLANPHDLPLPVTIAAHEIFKAARAAGKAGECEPVIELLEDLVGERVVK